MTVREAEKILADAGVENARNEARALFFNLSDADRLDITTLTAESCEPRLIDGVRRRARREPLQYILGTVGFCHEEYEVGGCLIPRQDTELLVEVASGLMPRGAHFLDLCCGTGCVGISTLARTEDTRATLVDISELATQVAERNAMRNGVRERVRLICADVLCDAVCDGVYAVLANPPYVEESEYLTLAPEIFYEPRAAFVAEEGGMQFYRRILEIYSEIILPTGFIAFEIGYNQKEKIEALADLYGWHSDIYCDLAGNCRVALLRRTREL